MRPDGCSQCSLSQLPGSLCIEGMLQLVGFYPGWRGYPGRGRALGVGEVRLTGQIRPSSRKVTYPIDMNPNFAIDGEFCIVSWCCIVCVGANSFARNGLCVRMNSHLQFSQSRELGETYR